MLAKQYRVTTDVEFEKVKRQGKQVEHRLFSFSFLDRKDKKPTRFGFIVSKKISNKASIRNKAKRALREAVRQSLAYVLPGYDCVFVARAGIEREYTDKIMGQVGIVLREAGVWKYRK